MYDNVVVVGICSRTFFYEKAGVRILRMISDMLKASNFERGLCKNLLFAHYRVGTPRVTTPKALSMSDFIKIDRKSVV